MDKGAARSHKGGKSMSTLIRAALMGAAFAASSTAWAQQAPTPTPPPTTGLVVFEADVSAGAIRISPLIYGVNEGALKSESALAAGFVRQGGNRMSGYNWELNVSNAGSDWHHQNDGHLSPSSEPAEVAVSRARETIERGRYVMLTIPMTDYVAADRLGNGDINQTPDWTTTRIVRNAARSPGEIPASPDLTDGAVYQDAFVERLKAELPEAFEEPVARIMFSLDNEADLWHHTHPRLFGVAEDQTPSFRYSDIFQRSETYAAMIKDHAPNAFVFGPSSFSWQGMRDFSGAPDADGRFFLAAYLEHMQQAEERAGRRLLDVLDVHWYPEIRGNDIRITTQDVSPEVVAARLQAPRALWDPDFVEDSWIGMWYGAIALIPRLQVLINRHYPGTRIAITEYNYGAVNHISGGLAQAEVLGIFGKTGVFAANLWPLSDNPAFALGAFLLYRDFDGEGGRFGDASIAITSTDRFYFPGFASYRSAAPGETVFVLLNKTGEARPAEIRLTGAETLPQTGRAFALTDAGPTPVEIDAPVIGEDGVARLILPAMSAVTIELR